MSDKPAAYVDHDGAIAYRASATGFCDTALIALRLGVQAMSPPQWMQDKFDEGHEREADIIRRTAEQEGLRLFRLQPEADQDEVRLTVVPSGMRPALRVVGHIDALGEHPVYGPIVVDAKALSKGSCESWERGGFEAWPHYAWQQSAYSYALAEMAVGEFKNRPLPIMMAILNKDTDEIRTWVFPEPPVPKSKIFAKLLKVEAAVKKGEIPTCTKTEWLCPVWHLHDETPTINAEVDVDQVERLAAQYNDVMLQAKALEARKRELSDDLKRALGKAGKVKTFDWTVSVSESARTSLDKDAMVADGIDVEKYTVKTVTKTLRVTKAKSKGGDEE